jgi:hypothetical protein
MKKLFGLWLLMLTASAVLAQDLGRMSGQVTDSSGAAVPGARIDLLLPGGSTPLATMTTGQEGIFRFASLRPVEYDVTVEAAGFRKVVLRKAKVDPGLELALDTIVLEVASQAEVIEVSASVQGVQTSNAEVAATVTNSQVTRLPSLNRSPLAFISIQAGVGGNGRTSTTINGLRPSFSNVTIDGINIQDNFIRTNTLDFQPNMLQLDQVAEFTVSTSNTNAGLGNGAAQVSFVTPSGSNTFQGNVRWFNRNNAVSANTWFNNRNNVKRPFLNQNQFGGSFRGPIKKDKLFFSFDYEATRLNQQAVANRTILRSDARNGIFTYRDTGGNVRTANLLTMFPGLTRSPVMQNILSQIPGSENINRDDIGDLLNTGGYSFNLRDNRMRDNVTAKIDYMLSSRQSFTASWIWNRDFDDRADLANDYVKVPKTSVNNRINLVSFTHRMTITPNMTNEARFGFNLAPGIFGTSEDFGGRIIGIPAMLAGNPVNTFRAQGRYTDTFNYSNGTNWMKGKHSLAFGVQGMIIHADPFNEALNLPGYSVGMSAAMSGIYNLNTPALLPGLRPQDLPMANSLLAFHAGMLTSANQRFNVTSRASGFVDGAATARRFRQQNVALYLNDAWRVNNRLTLTMGARWEFWSPVDEVDSLALVPVIPSGSNAIGALLSNATLDFAGRSAGRPWYGRDMNNFGPNVGLAWQPFGDGKTVIRAGYSINFPNDELIRSLDNSTATSEGLTSDQQLLNLRNAFADSPMAIPTPAFRVPRTLADNNAVNRLTAMGMPDPTLVTPYVQQWNFSVQREVLKGVFEVRYIGNRSTKQFRAFDFNQVMVRENGFLEDFNRALSNLRLSQAAGRGNNAAFNPAVPGSVPLPFFDRLPNGGALATNATYINLVNTGQAGQLASQYYEDRTNGVVDFFPNPLGLGMNMMTNYSNANYHGLQVDYTKRYASGWSWQVNYTYSKVLSDAAGDGQTRFEPFLDIRNAAIERSRTPFDLTHSFKSNGVWELPIGKGRRFGIENSILDGAFGGWGVSGMLTLNSGAPVSILAPRGTLNRTVRSGQNTATTNLNKEQLDEVLRFRQTGDGPFFVAASAIGADRRGVNADGAPTFPGQVFFNPSPGSLGALQRRMFSGPRFWNLDFQVFKTFRVSERVTSDLRGDFFNLTNSPSFFIGDQDINSINFGRITSTASARRVVQFGLYIRF